MKSVAGFPFLGRFFSGRVPSPEGASTVTKTTETEVLPRGWPPEQPTTEVGTLLRLAKWGVAGVGCCLLALAACLCLLALDRRDAADARQRIIEVLAAAQEK